MNNAGSLRLKKTTLIARLSYEFYKHWELKKISLGVRAY